MAKCDRCPEESKISIPYGPHKFCGGHFLEFFERRVRKTIRMNKLVKGRENIAVGVSGGKDSLVTLHILHSIFGKTNPIHAIMIDEGIKGYRDKALKFAKKSCEELGIDYTLVSMKDEIGFSMTEIMKKISKDKKLGKSCSYCGVFRRMLLNKTALELKAKKIATGHNLDDEVQSILMNFFDNDWVRMSRLGPIAGIKGFKKFVPRIKPLYETPESEVLAYASFNGIGHFSEECCPFSWQAKRNHFREMVNKMEGEMPGTKYKILASFREIKPKLKSFKGKGKPNSCKWCNSPASGEICQSCKQLEKIRKN